MQSIKFQKFEKGKDDSFTMNNNLNWIITVIAITFTLTLKT